MQAKSSLPSLVGMLYRAAHDSREWPSALQALADAVDSRAVVLMEQDVRTGALLEQRIVGVDSCWTRPYQEHFHALDPSRLFLERVSPGRMHAMHAHEDERSIKFSEYYQDFYLRTGLRYCCGGTIVTPSRRILLGVHRSTQQGAFNPSSVKTLQYLLEHMPSVAEIADISSHINHKLRLCAAALELLPQAIFVVRSDLRVEYFNNAAEIYTKRGNYIFIAGGRLALRHNGSRQTLERIVKLACEECLPLTAQALVLNDEWGRVALQLRATPLAPEIGRHIGGEMPLALITVIAPSIANVDEDIGKAYGLTRAEIRVAQSLAQGLTPGECAVKWQVSITTVRTQIRAILAKTGARRASEAAALLSRAG